ncbi:MULTISPECIES: 2-amino-3,7-dideoxy-D-threo-hept-6-ulosonate synthase [Saccharopolyspora]|uniref:2-amino-4,5-dihydroxy-6-one-heptanoic acid-7-phosphate synthase n=1 Tax=Saccharopolyspora elongata TaxID=2530387 RepID=A0A4R4YBW3_9PSEU|nr:2-amino-3,7-dideoxy-D-threo-hept-6-ulosonate synthase [Saccharopolyspora elongata]TDD42075.1 2-amino-4,5-dihydroxy-6-one-heptanoic acid-7-phosphate synthase [Saccharopolyspora elongata]
MSTTRSFGAQLRLRRMSRNGDDRLLLVPMDHSVTDGPLPTPGGPANLTPQLAANGVDAIVLHKGALRYIDPAAFVNMSLIVHLSASTAHAPDPDAKYLVASVETALRLGADAVSVHVNLGSTEERRQVADLAAVAEACDAWNLPLMAMIYPRGPQITDPRDVRLVAHAATLAADLGADLVKTVYPGTVEAMAQVVDSCAAPIVAAGGPRVDDEAKVLAHVEGVLRAGAAGVAMGRNIFEAPDPGERARRVAALIHPAREFTDDLVPELAS